MDMTAEFPWCVYLSLKHRTDRRAALLPRLQGARILADWFPATDGRDLRGGARGLLSAGRRALALTLRRVLREAERRRAAAVFILQDDAVFHPDFARLAAALALPADWGMFYFGCQHIETPVRHSPGVVRVRRALDAHAVAVRARWFHRVRRMLCEGGKRTAGGAYPDMQMAKLHGEVPTYAAFPNLVWQDEGWSDLMQRRCGNYDPDGGQRLWREVVRPLAP